jgi:hypothetical protein
MKLILITLVAVVVGMMVGCSSEPAATPTPSYPQISENEAIAMVKQHLQLIPVGKTHCLAFMQSDQYLTGLEFTGKPERDGVWIVKNVPLGNRQWFYTWKVYPTTGTVELIERISSSQSNMCP